MGSEGMSKERRARIEDGIRFPLDAHVCFTRFEEVLTAARDLLAELRRIEAISELRKRALEPWATLDVDSETWVGVDPATILLATKRDLDAAKEAHDAR
jgi:hypothetical protein